MPNRTVQQALAETRTMYTIAYRGYEDMCTADAQGRLTGLYNAIVFGRNVTITLQHMRSVSPEVRRAFNEWYAPYQKEMGEDPLLRHINGLRNAMLKENLQPGTRVHVKFNTNDLGPVWENKPPGATDFVMDSYGRPAWEVPMPDGSKERFYIRLPPELQHIIQAEFDFPNPPDTHLGQPIGDRSLPGLLALYFAYLDRLIKEATKKFGVEGVERL